MSQMMKERQMRDELEQDRKRDAKLFLYGPCDRCGPLTPRDPDATVADFFRDQYMDLCAECADELHAKQAKMDD